MSGLKPAIEHVQHWNPVQQEKKITLEQQLILRQVHLANILLFGAGTLDPEQQKLKNELQLSYLQSLKPWDNVEIWPFWRAYGDWTVVSNDWENIKVAASCYGNKKKKEWIRSFSCTTWLSKGPLIHKYHDEDNAEITRIYIVLPPSHTVQSTRWIPEEALKEIAVLYEQAGDPETSYDLVNNLRDKNTIPF